jgi:hypothetical protein
MVVLSGINHTEQNAAVHDFLAGKWRKNTGNHSALLEMGVDGGRIPEIVDLDAMVRFYGIVLHGMSIRGSRRRERRRTGFSRNYGQGLPVAFSRTKKGWYPAEPAHHPFSCPLTGQRDSTGAFRS